ncbi:hypothetical protein [Saccharicrinis aurantiacus]|uniref:hypothetical protein n=1 Tax=Saccharicrinis aurantiacus TaxID=1849719 RepID=UPI000838E182|nr:hypothetical protein [Saccharicrinis aurantiacus]
MNNRTIRVLKNIAYFSILWVQITIAQTNSLSPYSSFGVGRIENSGFGNNQGMGGAGIALPTTNRINALNAASLSGVDSLEMLFDIGLGINSTTYSSSSGDASAVSGGLNNIALAFKLSPIINTSIGISQFSSIGYNVTSSTYIDGGNSEINKSYEGSGGIDEVFISNSISIFKNFSLGLKFSYLFGQIKKTEYYNDSEIGGELELNYADNLKQIYFEPGFQYHINTTKNTFSIGGIYSPEVNFNSSRSVTTSSTSGAGIIEDIDGDNYELPSMMAGGVAWVNKSGIKLAIDYRLQKWSNIEYTSVKVSYKDSHKFAAGLEYTNTKSKRAAPYIWQLGGYYEDTYLKVKGKSIVDRGINLGVAVPLRNKDSYLNLNFNYGKRGTNDNTLITEDYYGMNLSLSIMEQWFKKQKLN